MICENCGNEHDGKYGSGRFCNSKCARGFSTKAKRKEINEKVSANLKGYKTVPGGKIKLCDYGCGQKAKFEMSSGKWCCEDHYNKCPEIKKRNSIGLKSSYKKGIRPNNGFPKESYQRGQQTHRENLKEYYDSLPFIEKPLVEKCRIVLNEQDEKCLLCGIMEWNGKSLVLHLDHIDGNNQNNERENLRYICPNCHSQTDTYCGKNINRSIKYKKVSDKILINSIKNSKSIASALINVGLAGKGANYKRVRRLMKENNL